MVRWQRQQWQQRVVQVGGPVEEAATQHIRTAQGQVNALAIYLCAGRSPHAALNSSRLCPLAHTFTHMIYLDRSTRTVELREGIF